MEHSILFYFNNRDEEFPIIKKEKNLVQNISTSYEENVTHSEAVYTSKLLDFKNLREPNNDLFDIEFSDSLRMDFTKLGINSKEDNKDDDGLNSDNEEIEYEEMEEEIIDETILICRSVGEEID
ncbi:hypothetical protein RhiirA4_463552 [Rhizophagus irregularis]|uniref:Uncharacterized protein n=1 Tax=Rhizophagus irregularis TaxID=588596 RepID=A0A2I1GNA2_9GLOM|nr:hypothetical protein RhiirA4_463552 [Rhizophagus irregularis]